MKKTLAFLLALTMVLTMTFTLGTSPASAAADSPEGVYALTGMDSGSAANLSLVSSIVDMGVKLYLVLGEDGTGSMNFLEAKIPLEWDEDGILFHSQRGDGFLPEVRIPFTVENGVLEIRARTYSMAFTALSEEERSDFETNGPGRLGGLLGRVVQGLIDRMDGGLAEGLVMDLMLGMTDEEPTPIPEGEPSAEAVSGTVDGMDFTILGADSVRYEGNDYLVFFFDAVNRDKELRAVWPYDLEAAQDGEFLELSFDLDSVIPEAFNVNFDIYPGRSIRCAAVFTFDPEGDTVGFRIRSYRDETELLYYADPQNLSGAPAEPFVFDADPSIPPELEALPEETEHVRIENVEFFTAENGDAGVRFDYRFVGLTEEEAFSYYCTPLQDGIELRGIWDMVETGEEDEDPERLHAYPCRLRTASPVVFVVFEEGSGETVPVAAKIVEVGAER